MALQISAHLEERIDRFVAEGRYASANDVLECAIDLLLAYYGQQDRLRAVLQEGLDDIENRRVDELTPELMERPIAESEEDERMGRPIDNDVLPPIA